MKQTHRLWLAATAALGLAASGFVAATAAHAARRGTGVNYVITAQWPGEFSTNVTVDNLGDPVNGWL